MRAHREAPNNPPAAARTFRLLSYKHTAPLSPLECALTKNQGGGVPTHLRLSTPVYLKGNTPQSLSLLISAKIRGLQEVRWLPVTRHQSPVTLFKFFGAVKCF